MAVEHGCALWTVEPVAAFNAHLPHLQRVFVAYVPPWEHVLHCYRPVVAYGYLYLEVECCEGVVEQVGLEGKQCVLLGYGDCHGLWLRFGFRLWLGFGGGFGFGSGLDDGYLVVIEDTECRVTDAWIVCCVQVTVHGKLLHTPLLCTNVHVGINDGKDFLLCGVLELCVVDNVLAELLP